ncbi:hypothetical protein [Thiomicrospira aerophila]|nr:hypothetical protein [Thiomicrospira aerophila]
MKIRYMAVLAGLVSHNTFIYAANDDQSLAWKPAIEFEYDNFQSSRFDNSRGELSLDVAKFKISNRYISVDYQHWNVDTKNIAELPFGDQQSKPIKQLESFNISTGYMARINPNWRWLNTLGLGVNYEKQINDATSVNLLSLGFYSLNPDLDIIAGFSYRYHPVQSRILPAVGLSYRANEFEGWSATLGFPRSFVNYGFAADWQVSAGLAYQRILAKLAKDSVIEADGYVEISNWQTDVRLIHRPAPAWEVFASLRYIPFYEFETYNQRGNRQDTYDLEPTVGAGLGVRYQF